MRRFDEWVGRRQARRVEKLGAEAALRKRAAAMRDQEMRRWVDDMVGRVMDHISAAERKPEPEPNRITMEATAHPLPDVPTQAEMDAAITWMIYLTNHEHGPTVRYGTVEL